MLGLYLGMQIRPVHADENFSSLLFKLSAIHCGVWNRMRSDGGEGFMTCALAREK